jgi:2-hydroxychromene-2-carboxylate isomerase
MTEPDLRPPEVDASKAEAIDWDNLDATYEAPGARDAVPDLPTVPDVTTPPPKDNWTWQHDDWAWKPPKEELPPPRQEVVTEENPLEIDVFYSMRSPYSYLSLFRYAYLHSAFNVDVSIKVIFPVAARTRHTGGKAGSGRWYFYGYTVMDAPRTGRYEGIPFRYANPDPILEDIRPQGEATMAVAPMEKQPYIAWLTRLAAAAQLEGKTLEYCLAVSPLIWGARTPLGEWPLHVEAAVNSIGLDYGATIEDIQANPSKYDDVWLKNQDDFQATGQGGVPTASFGGEPFFGQDRFDQLFWRLRQNNLTVRKERREPFVARPLRFPSGFGGE